jgi:imidazolonepropionase-like amidohydrolase
MLVAGHAIGSTGGHCDSSPFPPERVKPAGPLEGVCNGPEECRLAVRQQMKFGADVIKICASGGVLSESDPVDVPQLTPEELRAIMSEAHAWGRKVAAHSHGDLAAKLAVEAGVDSIEHGSFLQPADVAADEAEGRVPGADAHDPGVGARQGRHLLRRRSAPRRARPATAHEAMFRNALRIGVPIAFGTDAACLPHGLNAQEFGDMVDLGMTPAAALLSSSQGAAKLLGVDGETGHARKQASTPTWSPCPATCSNTSVRPSTRRS